MNIKLILKIFGATGTAVAGATAYKASHSLEWANNVVLATGIENENKNFAVVDTATTGTDKPDLTLKQVQIYFRHGARTPLSKIPNVEEANWDKQLFLSGVPHTLFDYKLCDLNGDPPPDSPLENHYRKTVLKGGSYIGQLTSLGQDQTYLLGRRIRQRYIEQFGLIEARYDPENFYCRSTNTQRTIDSLRCVVAGIFGAQHLNEVGNVVLYTAHILDEVLSPNSQRCSFLKQLIHKTLTNFGNINGVLEDRLDLERVLGVDSSSDVKKRLNMVNVRDNLVCRKSHGFLIPEQMREFESRLMKYGLDMMVYAYTGTKGSFQEDVLRASTGLSLDLLLRKMDEAVEGKKGPKLILYSCHDTSIISLLMALGIYDQKWPPFAADVAVELYADNKGRHFVKVLYNGENVTEQGFGSPVVSLKKLKEGLARFVVADAAYNKLCQSKFPEKLEAPLGLNLPEGSYLPEHQETPEEATDADEHSVRPAGL